MDYAIPANDDATKSISLILNTVAKAIEEGLAERKVDKDKDAENEKEGKDGSSKFDNELDEDGNPNVSFKKGSKDKEEAPAKRTTKRPRAKA